MVRFSNNTKAAYWAAKRFRDLGGQFESDEVSFVMDLIAADGVNGNAPLDWSALIAAPDFGFLHDCYGIQRHMDRETGALCGCFLPRYAVIETEST